MRCNTGCSHLKEEVPKKNIPAPNPTRIVEMQFLLHLQRRKPTLIRSR